MANGDEKKDNKRKLPPRDPQTGRFMKKENAERDKAVEKEKELSYWEKQRQKRLDENLDKLYQEYGLKEKLVSLEDERRNISNDLAKLARQHKDNISKTGDNLRENESIEKDILKAEELILNTEGMQQDLAIKLLESLQKELKTTEQIKDAMGATGSAMEGLNKIFKGALGSSTEILKNTKKRLKALADQGKLQDGLKGKMQGFGILIGEIGKSLVKSLSDPMTYIMALLENSKAMTQFRKELGLSYKESMGLRMEMSTLAIASEDVFITSKKLQESFMNMTQELGFIADFSGQTLETMTNLTKRLGMGNKEAAEMTMMFKMQGDNTEEIASNLMDGLTASIKQGKVALTEKQIFGEIAKTSKTIQVSLAANPLAIGKAIIAAKQFGAELADIDTIAGSLLNFEQSISSELEAELLTGKQLNLERARLLALNNDFEGVAKEISQQGIDYNFMTTANRLEQEAAAKALGLSRDRLAEITFQEAIRGKSMDEIRQSMGEGAYEQAKQLDAAQKFEASVDKIKGLFVDIMTVLTPVIDAFGMIVDFTFSIGGALTLAGGAVGLITSKLPAMVKGFKAMSMMSMKEAIFSSVSSMWTITKAFVKKLGPIGLGLAVGAIGGIAALIATKAKKKMATGGLIKPKAGGVDITAAEAGEAELITPVSKAAETLATMTGADKNQNTAIDYDKMASAMAKVTVKTDYSGFGSKTQQGNGFYASSVMYDGEMS